MKEFQLRPTHILIECPQLIASVRVGVLEPLSGLEHSGACELHYRDTKDITRADIAWCDILITVRGCEYPTLRVVQAAKKAGRFLIYFLDDDLLDIPRGNSSTDYYSDYAIKANLTKVLSKCNLLWAVNQNVIDKYQRWCGRTVLSKVPAVPRREPPEPGDFRVLYAGSVDHSGLVREKLSPAVARLLEEFPGRIDFTFIGADPQLKGLKGVRHIPYAESYDAYEKIISEGNFTLGLAPAYHTPFYRCKYYNKFVEYSKNGIAGLYEGCEPYTHIVRDGENGFLCPGEPEDWYQGIKSLFLAPEKVWNAAVNAENQLRDEFDLMQIDHALLGDIPELDSWRAPAVEESMIDLAPMHVLFYQERILLLARIYGLAVIFVLFWKVLKKLIKWLKRRGNGDV